MLSKGVVGGSCVSPLPSEEGCCIFAYLADNTFALSYILSVFVSKMVVILFQLYVFHILSATTC